MGKAIKWYAEGIQKKRLRSRPLPLRDRFSEQLKENVEEADHRSRQRKKSVHKNKARAPRLSAFSRSSIARRALRPRGVTTESKKVSLRFLLMRRWEKNQFPAFLKNPVRRVGEQGSVGGDGRFIADIKGNVNRV